MDTNSEKRNHDKRAYPAARHGARQTVTDAALCAWTRAGHLTEAEIQAAARALEAELQATRARGKT